MLRLLGIFAASVFIAANAVAAPAAAPQVDGNELLTLGFKVLVAKTRVQEDWVKQMAPGKIRAMQRTGKKYFIYPDAPGKQIYVGGPKEYDTYVQRHPEHRVADSTQAAKDSSAYRAKRTDEMKEASARDLSDPFLGVTWGDLGW